MKTNIRLFLLATFCGTLLAMTGCMQNGQEPTEGDEPPAPDFLIVTGTVTDMDGVPLPSIHMFVDTTTIEKYNDRSIIWWWDMMERYTDKEGCFELYYEYGGNEFEPTAWPSELTVVAVDTTGVYETQSNVLPVETKPRYKDAWMGIYDGRVENADFVLKIKNPNKQ